MRALCQNNDNSKLAAFMLASRAGAAGNESLGQIIYRYIKVYRPIYIAYRLRWEMLFSSMLFRLKFRGPVVLFRNYGHTKTAVIWGY